MRVVLSLCLAIILSCSISTRAGDIYKWVDEDGNVHFGDKPQDNASETVEIKSYGTGETLNDEQVQERLDQYRSELAESKAAREREKSEKQEEQAKKKRKEKYCARLKDQLAKYERGGYVWYDLDESGERKYMSDDQVRSRAEKFRKKYRKECS